MKKVFKSLLTIAVLAAIGVGSANAFFTSSVSAANNQVIVGSLRLAIDSTQTHTAAPHVWGAPNSYTVAQDAGGITTFLANLETWMYAVPGTAVPYANTAGADTLPAGNHSWWISLRNAGNIPMLVSADLSSGTWTPDAAVLAANPTCTATYLNSSNPFSVNNVTFYGRTDGVISNICKSHEECENIYYGLTSGPWVYTTSANANVDSSFVPTTSPVRLSTNGTATLGNAIVLNQSEFIIARVDASFNTSDNCYQGATYSYTLNGDAYQVADSGSW